MKKLAAIILTGILTVSLSGVASIAAIAAETTDVSSQAFYTSTDEVTLEKIEEMSSPEKMLEYKGGVEVEYTYQNTGDYNLDNGKTCVKYKKDNDVVHVNQMADYPNGYFSHFYFSNDPEDAFLYMQSDSENSKSPLPTEDANAMIRKSFYGFASLGATLVSVTEENGTYTAQIELSQDGSKLLDTTIILDPVSGYADSSETVYYQDGKEGKRQIIDITYSAETEIDYSPKTALDEPAEDATEATEEADRSLRFSSTDIDGNPVTDEIIRDAKVVMINFWEPWCGPCVGEMPDLEKLYENYKDQGLLILGVFSTTNMDDDARAILEDNGITYPVVRCDSDLAKFETDYYPTTIFADGEGNILSDEPTLGANSYSDWEKIIESYLN